MPNRIKMCIDFVRLFQGEGAVVAVHSRHEASRVTTSAVQTGQMCSTQTQSRHDNRPPLDFYVEHSG
jgi:hypothetical protein